MTNISMAITNYRAFSHRLFCLIQFFQIMNSKFLVYNIFQGQTNICEFWESKDYF